MTDFARTAHAVKQPADLPGLTVMAHKLSSEALDSQESALKDQAM